MAGANFSMLTLVFRAKDKPLIKAAGIDAVTATYTPAKNDKLAVNKKLSLRCVL